MKKVTLDNDRFAAAGMSVLPPKDGVAVIILPGEQDLVRCKIDGDQLSLFPERSSGQRAILKALGVL